MLNIGLGDELKSAHAKCEEAEREVRVSAEWTIRMVVLIALLTANEEQKEREKGGRGKVLFLFCFVISVFQNLFFSRAAPVHSPAELSASRCITIHGKASASSVSQN